MYDQQATMRVFGVSVGEIHGAEVPTEKGWWTLSLGRGDKKQHKGGEEEEGLKRFLILHAFT